MDGWRNAPWEDASESWEVSARPGKETLLEDGTPLSAYIDSLVHLRIFGRLKPFPMLIKVIAPRLHLSVQVHPDEETCRLTGGESKAEAWIVLHAPPGAFFYAGLKIPAEELPRALEEGRIVSCLHRVSVKTGDCIWIPGGLVHALTPGVMVYEIQQSSDTTFRIYDWDRLDANGKPRSLHLREAVLAVKDFPPVAPIQGAVSVLEGGSRERLLQHPDFCLDALHIDGILRESVSYFTALTVTQGEGALLWKGKEFPMVRGETWLAPVGVDTVLFRGKMEILKAYLF